VAFPNSSNCSWFSLKLEIARSPSNGSALEYGILSFGKLFLTAFSTSFQLTLKSGVSLVSAVLKWTIILHTIREMFKINYWSIIESINLRVIKVGQSHDQVAFFINLILLLYLFCFIFFFLVCFGFSLLLAISSECRQCFVILSTDLLVVRADLNLIRVLDGAYYIVGRNFHLFDFITVHQIAKFQPSLNQHKILQWLGRILTSELALILLWKNSSLLKFLSLR